MGKRADRRLELGDLCRLSGLGKLFWRSDHSSWSSWECYDVAMIVVGDKRHHFTDVASVQRFVSGHSLHRPVNRLRAPV